MSMHEKILEDLKWRYATKKFDPSKKITDKDLEVLLEVLRLTPSSYGLQPLKFLVIDNPGIREELFQFSFGQRQITDASHLIVFCSYTAISPEYIDKHIANTALIRQQDRQRLERYSTFMKETFNKMSDSELERWAENQAYIALGQFLHACALLRIDAIPMEGFDPNGYKVVLDLEKQFLKATLVCPIGYRSEEDTYQQLNKVRKAPEDLFEFIH